MMKSQQIPKLMTVRLPDLSAPLRSAPGKSEKPLSPYPSRLEGLVWIRLGFSSDFPQELGLYA